MNNLAYRIKDTLGRAGLNPRVLAGLTKIHYTTIYALLKNEEARPTPVVEDTLSKCLDKLNTLVGDNKLPLVGTHTTQDKIPLVLALVESI